MSALGDAPSRWSSVLRSSVLALMLLLGALACSSGSTETVEVVVDPATVTLAPGESVELQATVTGTRDTRVQWRVTAGGGSVDDSGRYTAPAEEGSAQVRATSVVSPESFTHVQVMVKKAPPVLRLTLLPASRKLGVGQVARFEAQLSQGTGTEQLEWRVEEGSQGGIVTEAGPGAAWYQAPATPGTFHLEVSVRGRPELSARATLTVTQEPPQPTLRGTVNYTGQRKGRVHIVFAWGYGSGESLYPQLSTSLEAPGAYSLRPLRGSSPPTFVLAFIDTQGTGTLNRVTDPMALVPIHLTGEDQALDLTLADPSQPPALTELAAGPQAVGTSDGLLLVAFGSAYDSGGTFGELADSYNLYWSLQRDPGPDNFVGRRTVSAGQVLSEHGYLALVPGLPAGQYYVGVAPVQGGVEGSVHATFSPVEVGRAPQAGATLSGQVQLEAPVDSGSVYVVAARETDMLITRVPMSASTVSWSISGLAEGEYTVWALLDANGDNLLERATPRVGARPRVTVSGTAPVTAPDLSFVGVPAAMRATSLQQNGWVMAGGARAGGLFYRFSLVPGSKQPVAVRLTGGQGLPTPYDVPGSIAAPFFGSLWGTEAAPFGLEWYAANESSALPVGARFNVEVRLADGSTEQHFVDAPPVLPIPALTSPIESATASSTPTFVWSLPTGLAASLTQRLTVRQDTLFGTLKWSRLVPLSQTQVTYNDDGKASALSPGETYFWDVELSDGQGNIGRGSQFFEVQ